MDKLILKYHWSGEGNPVSGHWVDRISGARFAVSGGVREGEAYHFCQGTSARMVGSGALSLGRHFKVIIDATATMQPRSESELPCVIFCDFQSLGNMSFGFDCGIDYGTNRPSINGKRHGGMPFNKNTFIMELNVPCSGIFEYANEPFDDNRDIWSSRFNRQAKVYTAPHGPCPQDELRKDYIVLNTGATAQGWNNQYYCQDIIYRSIKIFTEP